MTESKNIKENIEHWKANMDLHQCEGNEKHYQFSKGVIYGLELAKSCLIKPPNQEVANVCAVCGESAEIKVVGKNRHYCDNCIA